jgi:hypothetical protein
MAARFTTTTMNALLKTSMIAALALAISGSVGVGVAPK